MTPQRDPEERSGAPLGAPLGGLQCSQGAPKEHPKGPAAAHPSPATAKLPDDALVDGRGRSLCYAFLHGKCSDPNYKRYHDPETKAMRKKRLAGAKKASEACAAQGSPTAVATDPKASPKPKGGNR